jgi:hypothetical protein
LHHLRDPDTILEMIGTNEARMLLQELAKGAPEMIVTREARKRLMGVSNGKSK